jgi:uncharacterized protein (TIGR02145 family)
MAATVVNGGSAPQYQWQVNGINAGTNSPVFTYNPVNNDIIACILNSSLYCSQGSPATSNNITMMVVGAPCPGLATVSHGGKTYHTVQIGTQCWLRENLNYGLKINGSQNQTNNSVVEKYCYNDLESNCDIYGGHYQWDEALQYISGQGVNGICPQGWHIPADAEWTILTDLLNGSAEAGGKMKEQGSLHWASPNTGATNFSGFTALPGGIRSTGSFSGLTTYGYFWSSTAYDNLNAWRVMLRNDGAQTSRLNNLKANGYSVRCLKDETVPNIRFLENIVVPNGHNKCYNATRTITTAGNGTAFTVMNGGAATMIAGKNILCYPGTSVAAGGYLHGYIAPSGPFCTNPAMPAVITGENQLPALLAQQVYKIYPNPTTGKFTLEFSAEPAGGKLLVRLFNMTGAEITGVQITEGRKTEISLENQSPGIYLVAIISEGKMEIVKVVKL